MELTFDLKSEKKYNIKNIHVFLIFQDEEQNVPILQKEVTCDMTKLSENTPGS